jgi:hypothetical protein
MDCPHGKDPDQCLICWSEFNVRLERLRVQFGLRWEEFERLVTEWIAKHKGGIMKPEELARQIVGDHMTVGDLEWLIRQHLDERSA